MKAKKSQRYLYLTMIIIVIIGIFLRFVNLDNKVYWHDEIYTTLHINGYGWDQWKTNVFTGKIIGVDTLQYYLHLNPNKTLADTLNILAKDDPHHPPLYYTLVRYWRQFFGDSITIIRSFSAFVSLLILPAISWFSWELFGLHLVGIITIILVAISPFFVLYAQEAREYALWTVFLILSNSSLLRAIKLTKNKVNLQKKDYLFWGIYSLSTMLSLYTSLVSIFVIISQIVYLIFAQGFRITKIIILQGLALLISFITFIPWILVFFGNYEQYETATSWTRESTVSNLLLFQNLGLNLTRIFFDLDWRFYNLLTYLVVFGVLLLVVYALYFLYKNTSPKSWELIFALIIIQLVFLFIPDLLWGGIRSISLRYLTPSVVAIDLAVAYLLSGKLIKHNTNPINIWSVITIMIFSSGVISCTINSQSDTSWSKYISSDLPLVSQIINATNYPLLISNDQSYHPGNIMALSYLLKPDVKLQLLSEEKGYKIPDKFRNIFLLNPSDELRESLENQSGVKAKPIPSDHYIGLWKIELNHINYKISE